MDRCGALQEWQGHVGHLVAGFIGTLYVGFFAIDSGWFTGGTVDQVIVQLIPAVAVAVYSFTIAYVLGVAIDKTIGFRATEEGYALT